MIKLFIYLGLLILALLFRNKKYFDWLIIIGLTLLCVLSPNISDMGPYTIYYDSIGSGVKDTFLGYGWLGLCIVGNFFHLPYLAFKTILYCISLIIIRFSLRKIFDSVCLPLILYAIFPSLLDIIQIRFFVASAIVIAALVELIRAKAWQGYLKYFLLMMVACLLHNSCIFYFIFCFIPFIIKKKWFTQATLIMLMCVLFFIIFRNDIPYLLYKVLPPSQWPRISNYFDGDHISFLAFIVYSFLFAIQLILIYMIRRYYKSNENELSSESLYKIDFIFVLNILCYLSMIFIYQNSDFLRLQRGILILNYALYSEYYFKVKTEEIIVNAGFCKVKINYNQILIFMFFIYFVLFNVMFNREAIIVMFS